MPLRFQLLLLSLLTLLLPWAGCQYAREMESVLREGQAETLLASAGTLASFIASQPQLLEERPGEEGAATAPFDPQAGDIYAYRLSARPLLDGFGDEWALPPHAWRRLQAPDTTLAVEYVAGVEANYFYLLLHVIDDQVQLERTSDARLEPEGRSDHVWLDFTTPEGLRDTLLIATSAPGLISARRTTVSTYGERGEQLEPRVQAFWQPESDGYRLEARVPLGMVGASFGFEVVDIADSFAPEALPARVGTLDASTRQARGRVLLPSEMLARELIPLLPPATRVAVGDVNGWILAETGSIDASPIYDERPSAFLQAVYRRFLESGREDLPPRREPAGLLEGTHVEQALAGERGRAWFRLRDEGRRVLAVGTPVIVQGERAGVLTLEQSGDRLLTLRDRALTRLLNLTLLATATAVVAMLAFATLLGTRLARLKRAAETALTRDGRLNVSMPETRSRDELGDLARSFDTLLRRLNEYTAYLRTLGGKLSHEMRTPLAIVRSSLENLESERASGGEAGAYVARAREGTERLQTILTAMGAATRTEEAIAQAERTRFDLGELVESACAAYADAFRERRFQAHAVRPCPFVGAPDLIVQLLDKLVENAVDFSSRDSEIRLELSIEGPWIALAVSNQGPVIADAMRSRLFDSMFEFRRDADARPHFGLGLYIVRLVADFHGGSVFAENLPAADGVRIGVRLPRPTGF